MADEGITPGTEGTDGQPDEGIQDTGIIQAGTEGTEGQPGAEDGQGTTQQGTQAGTDETFFDPTDLEGKPELQAAYKQMQRAFGKGMEGIKAGREKIAAYDSFQADPVTQMQQMAGRMGYQLTRAEAAQQLQQNDPNKQWEPQNWEEVMQRAEDRAYSRLQKENAPMMGEVERLRKSNLESFLDTNAPDWREFEDNMMDKLRTHPTLLNDPMSLYSLSVPPEVLAGRAAQQALKKLQAKGQSAQVSGGSTTTRRGKAGLPDKAMSFDEAVKYAETQLAEDGIRKG